MSEGLILRYGCRKITLSTTRKVSFTKYEFPQPIKQTGIIFKLLFLSSGRRIIASLMKRMAFQHPFESQPSPTKRAITAYNGNSISAACRMKTAVPPYKRADAQLIDSDQEKTNPGETLLHLFRPFPSFIAATILCTSCLSASKGLSIV